MKTYIEIAQADEIPKNGMKKFNVKGLEILIINARNNFYAVDNRCPHLEYPLYLGSLQGTTLTCGFHHAKFDITTGKALNRVTSKPLKTFKLKTKNSRILIKPQNNTTNTQNPFGT